MSRILLLLALLCSLPAFGQDDQEVPQQDQSAEKSAEETQEESSQEPTLLTPAVSSQGATVDAQTNSNVSNQDADKQSDRNPEFEVAQSDLKAQWIMAVAAVIIVLIAMGSLFVSIWATILIRSTLKSNKSLLKLSWKAVAAGRRSAKAAEDTVEQTKISSKAELRAYVSLNVTGFQKSRSISSLLAPESSGTPQLVIRFLIKNSGITPANNVSWAFRSCFTQDSKTLDSANFASFQPDDPLWHDIGTLASGEEIKQSITVTVPKVEVDLTQGIVDLGMTTTYYHEYVIGRFMIRFQDVFKREIVNYVTGFTYASIILEEDGPTKEINLPFKICGVYPLNGEDIDGKRTN